MTNRWCGGALFCSVLGSIVVYLLLFPFKSTIKVISLPSRKEMLLWFAHSESADCEIYHEFGGVLNRMYKPSPALFFMDGQKSVCLDPVSLAPPVDNCLVYSFGNNAEWSFDQAMESYGCEVFTFDPSMRDKDHRHSERIWFYQLGLGVLDEKKDKRGWKLKTLPSIRQMLNHTERVIDVLKLDIEGDEWSLLLSDDFLSSINDSVRQLAMEVHIGDTAESIDANYRLRQFEQQSPFVRFFSRENPWARNTLTGTSCYEMAWYNKKFLS